MMEAGNELMKTLAAVGQTGAMIAAEGFPAMGSEHCQDPFDYLGDTLRGTKGILMDMYRRPNELLAACEAYVPVLIKAIIGASDRSGSRRRSTCCTRVQMPSCPRRSSRSSTGRPGSRSCWRCTKKGITSYLFIEGSYNKRLENLAEMPEKSLVCHFDQTEMGPVKEILSDKFHHNRQRARLADVSRHH